MDRWWSHTSTNTATPIARCQETSATENTTCIELAKSTLEELRLEQGWAGSGLEKRPTWR